MANIRKLPNGKWEVTVYVGRDPNGKNLRRYARAYSEREAKQIARDLENEIASKNITRVSMMKMTDWMEMWFEITRPLIAPTTRKAYRLYIEKHFTPAFGDIRVCDLTDLHIKAYIANKLTVDELSPTTVRKHFYTLHKILFDALKYNSPMIGMKPPAPATFIPVLPKKEEFEQIRAAFAELGPEHEVVILLAGWCGMRRGEIFALKWEDIDEKNGYIRIDEALALKEDEYSFEYKEPKSKNGIRTVAVPDYLIWLLKKIKNNRKIIKQEVFSITPGSWSNLYAKVIKNKNLPKIRFHNLRHYHATFLYDHGLSDQYAANRLGHDIWVLKRIYQHLGLDKKGEQDEHVRKLYE